MSTTVQGRKRDVSAGGAVMVITLLAIILIASLLFYVFNTGKSVQGRIVTQHAADAAAIGGAGQVARALNTVAMNNVETARIIAAVNVLDGIPLAVDLSVTDESEPGLGDLDAIAQAVRAQLQEGVVDAWLEHKLREMVDPTNTEGLIVELQQMRELDELFRGNPQMIPSMTRYRTPSGAMGLMHQAMRAMDAHSRAVMRSMGEAAQSSASHSAQANFGGGDAGALLLPASPRIPWQRGAFVDYERPARFGLLPGADTRLKADNTQTGLGQIDNKLINRGPWDALFGWRHTNATEADPGRVPTGAAVPPRAGPPTPAVEPKFYDVVGPDAMWQSVLPRSRFARLHNIESPVFAPGHLTELTHRKSGYLWDQLPQSDIRDTQWEIDIAFDGERSSDRNDDCLDSLPPGLRAGSLFVVVEMKSRRPGEKGLAQARGQTWNYVDQPGRQSPYVIYRSDWFDPDRLDGYQLLGALSRNVKGAPTWKKVQKYVWRISAVYQTDPAGPDLGGDPSIGLAPKIVGKGATGAPVYAAQEVFWEIDVMLVGANVGQMVAVDNPWEGFDRDAPDSPAPIDLMATDLPADNPQARFQYLTFLGIARQSNKPTFWPSRFQGSQPYPYNTALGQACVFNNHSWDLWTQAWQSRLEPVDIDRFDDWVGLADEAAAADVDAVGLDRDEVRGIADHLRSVSTLAPAMLNH